MTTCKTGVEHINSLKDSRTVYIDGKLVDDVTVHPAFRNSVRSAGALYDFPARDENAEAMTFTPNGANRRINRCWQLPRSHAEMVQRRKAMQAWAALHCGFMGRSPDHIASTLVGQLMGIEVFYAGAKFVTAGHSFRTFDWPGATGMLDDLMASYDLADELKRISARPRESGDPEPG